MKVSDLQDILGMIRQMLVSAGSKGPAGELAEFGEALDPFRGLTAKQLASELRKLTEAPKKPKAGKAAKLTVDEVNAVIADVKALYDRAGSPTTTAAGVEAKTQRLGTLGKPDLVRAAEALGISSKGLKSKSIPVLTAEIRKRIEARMGASQRMGMIDVVVGEGR